MNQLTDLEPSLEKQLKGHRHSITSLCFSPNEKQIASGSLDNSVLLWDLRGTMRSYRFQGHNEAVTDVTFSPSGKYMATASRDKSVRLWVPTVTGSTGMFKAHSQTVRSVQFSSDGSKIITASDDKIVKMWSSEKHKFISSFTGHTNWVRCARMSFDGSVIASCSDDKTTKLWNPESGECIHTYKDQKGYGLYLAWHPTGCYVAVGTSNGNVKLYDVRTHCLIQYYSIHKKAVTQLAFHPSGRYITTTSEDSTIKILDLMEGHPIFTLSGHDGKVHAVSISASGDSFATAGEDELVFIWRTNFTEMASDLKENEIQNQSSVPRSTSQSSKVISARGRNQGTSLWYQCYHSTKYPVANFVYVNVPEPTPSARVATSSPKVVTTSSKLTTAPPNNVIHEPDANSTLLDLSQETINRKSTVGETSTGVGTRVGNMSAHTEPESYSVGHMSHLPRIPPQPSTYTVPSIMNRSMETAYNDIEHEELFGLIKLSNNDVCYTSGIIEWVGRKRSFPINSGFKIISENTKLMNEPIIKKVRLDQTYSINEDKVRECGCNDVLPTVNAVVDHLNALHEAVDLVDLRLNTLEDAMST